MGLPQIWETRLYSLIEENNGLYEPRMETAKSYNDLKEKLQERGYTNIPAGVVPLLQFGNYGTLPIANTSSVEVVQTMLRKKK